MAAQEVAASFDPPHSDEASLQRSVAEVAGVRGPVERLWLDVPEDHADEAGRRIRLHALLLRCTGEAREPDPLFVLQGGPGQAASEIAAFCADVFDGVRSSRDVVLMDVRGTGSSNPLPAVVAPDELLVDLHEAIPARWVPATLERSAERADLRHYGTEAAMRDLDRLRAALGAEHINLYGTSYGTRCALVYLRLFPERARSVVLKAVAPMQLAVGLDYARDADEALASVFAACERDEAWRSMDPDPPHMFATILERLAAEPVEAEVQHPLTGERVPVSISRDAFAHAVRTLLYAPSTQSQLPRIVADAYGGDFEAVALILARARFVYATRMALGASLCVLASEDAPRATEARIVERSSGTFLGDAWVRGLQRLVRTWPGEPAPGAFFEPVASNVPVLMISGGADPATPPRWAELAGATLSRARHVVAPEAAHSFDRFAGCLEGVIAEFVARGAHDGLDLSCFDEITRPAFAPPPDDL